MPAGKPARGGEALRQGSRPQRQLGSVLERKLAIIVQSRSSIPGCCPGKTENLCSVKNPGTRVYSDLRVIA